MKMAKRRPLFRRDADRLSLHFQLFDPVRFDAPFFLDNPFGVFRVQKISEGDSLPFVDGLSVQYIIVDVAFLAGGYEEDVPGVIARNNRRTRFLGVD